MAVGVGGGTLSRILAASLQPHPQARSSFPHGPSPMGSGNTNNHAATPHAATSSSGLETARMLVSRLAGLDTAEEQRLAAEAEAGRKVTRAAKTAVPLPPTHQLCALGPYLPTPHHHMA